MQIEATVVSRKTAALLHAERRASHFPGKGHPLVFSAYEQVEQPGFLCVEAIGPQHKPVQDAFSLSFERTSDRQSASERTIRLPPRFEAA
ncbi:MAG: hypothetical protein HPM95_07715 [Alphaproteobacteria bacterium]|nr:hypothetical protein [Alphaproteobacteria bacterium]